MDDFENMFMESMGKPVEYNGNILYMKDDFPIKGHTSLKVIFERTESKWKQGIGLRCNKGIKINDKECGNQVVLWEDTSPKVIEVQVPSDAETVEIKNVWNTGDGVIQSWHNGAAMMVEILTNGRRYRCNDGQQNDDFSDIMFRVEI